LVSLVIYIGLFTKETHVYIYDNEDFVVIYIYMGLFCEGGTHTHVRTHAHTHAHTHTHTHTHIHGVAQALLSPVEEGAALARLLGADYVLVVFGGECVCVRVCGCECECG